MSYFCVLFGTVVEVCVCLFFRTNSLLSDELKEIRHDIAYISELFAEFNEMNLHLQ